MTDDDRTETQTATRNSLARSLGYTRLGRKADYSWFLAQWGEKVRAAYLPLTVDTHDTAGGCVFGGDEDRLRRDAVHVDAHASLDLVQVHVAVLGHDVDDAVFG